MTILAGTVNCKYFKSQRYWNWIALIDNEAEAIMLPCTNANVTVMAVDVTMDDEWTMRREKVSLVGDVMQQLYFDLITSCADALK